MLPEGSRTHNRPKSPPPVSIPEPGRPSDKSRFGGRRGGETGGQGLAETHRKHEPIPDVSQALRRVWVRPGGFLDAPGPPPFFPSLRPPLPQPRRNVTPRAIFVSLVGGLFP